MKTIDSIDCDYLRRSKLDSEEGNNCTELSQKIDYQVLEDVEYPKNKEYKNLDLRFSKMSYVIGKKCKFSSCSFDKSFMKFCYFRNATFINCTFTRTHFENCNFKGATFIGCDFKFSNFHKTIIEPEQVKKNLPDWENATRDLMRIHRVNAESVGDTDAVKQYIKLEMAASREHFRLARLKRTSWYSKKYSGFTKGLEIRLKSLLLLIEFHLWGHGESPFKIFRFLVLLVLVFSAFNYFDQYIISETVENHKSYSFMFSLKQILSAFLGVGDENPQVYFYNQVLLVFFRYLIIGLFVGVVAKRIARR